MESKANNQMANVMKDMENDNMAILNVVGSDVSYEVDGEKRSFVSFTTVDKKGRKCRLKFTKECENVPKKAGKYKMIIDKNNMNIDKNSIYYTVWVEQIETVEKVDKFERKNRVEELDF